MWQMNVYRLARFVADRSWNDVKLPGANHHTRKIAADLNRALGAICADLSEGYSRSSGRDRVRFYEYALGVCPRVTRLVSPGRTRARPQTRGLAVELLNRICRLTLSLIPAERRRQIRPSNRTPSRT